MYFKEIKFQFDITSTDREIDNNFKKLKPELDIQFDDNLKAYHSKQDVTYNFLNISDFNQETIKNEIKHFFNFGFNEIIDVPLYKFLILKNHEEYTVLAIINSLIFDFSSINDFYNIFSKKDDAFLERDILNHHESTVSYLSFSEFEEESDYWKNYLLNTGDNAKFYSIKSREYNNIEIPIDNEAITDFSNEHNVSKFDFFAALFALYLSRIDRTKGCILKTLTPNENKDALNKNTLINIDYLKDTTFADYLKETKNSYIQACEHTKVDIENYLDDEASYYAIYDLESMNIISKSQSKIYICNGHGNALTMNIYEDFIELIYHEDSFSEVYMQHMADNIESLMNNLIESPNQLLKEAKILSNREEDLLSEYTKGITADVDENFIFSAAFRQLAKENPTALAVDDGVNTITYGELEKSSNSLAHDLSKNHGISVGSNVAVILPRTYHFPEIVFALNKIGAAFVPIDLIYPKKRIDHMLNISESVCIITTKEISEKYDFDIDVICFEDLDRDSDVEVEILAKGENLFSIMFTSGTTGLPKGVMVSNHQLSGLYVSFKNIFNFSYGDLVGCYLSFSFIASYVIHVTLALGGCVRIYNEREQRDILSLIQSLKENHMNSMILPPTVGIPILENDDIQLDYLVFAGAKLNELSKKERDTQLINFYGTTEIVFGVTKVYDLNDIEGNHVPIGRPVSNTNVYILDENLNQMPIGVSGEICVSSDYISPGYYNNPELTRKSFVDNPFIESKKMYRTGDIGFYNFDGEIEIIGREDDQLSVRGFRIESGEILSIIKNFEEIEDLYLDVDQDTLVLYYTTNGPLDIDVVKDTIMVDLPSYMVPSLFIELDEIPLNLNGKIDKTALKRMTKEKSDIDINDDVLATVIDAFKEVLSVDVVYMDDGFIELGGTSLSAMKLQIYLKDKFGANLSSNEILELSTPAKIADHIKFNMDDRAPITVNYNFEEGCPLSNAQLNVYLDEMVNDMGTGYNNPFKVEIDSEEHSFENIKEALIKLCDAFPILKARVVSDEDGPRCVFDAEVEIIEGTYEDVKTFVAPFELEKNLCRFLIAPWEDKIILCSDFHHLVFDGTSFGIVFERLYSILNNGETDFVDDGVLKQISFEENLSPNYESEAQEFFDIMLADSDEIDDLLPSAKSEKSLETDEEEYYLRDQSQAVYRERFEIDIDNLSSFLQKNQITPNQFFTSVFAYTLSRFTGSSKVLFNLIEDGRGHIDLSQSVGMYVKTLPLVIDCANKELNSYLKESSRLINAAMKYDLYPFHILANKYDLNSSIFFQYSHEIFATALNQEKFGFNVDEMNHDLNSEFSFSIFNLGKDEFAIGMEFSDKYSREFIEQFVKTYKMILKEMLKVEKLEEINYIDSEDIKLLNSYNETSHNLIYNDILDAFNENLAKYPNNVLVSFKERKYTYAEGAFIAKKIAERLVELGVHPQDFVSFLVERSELYMFTSLAILSIGAVYVPLDDGHPDERIEYILSDTQSKVLIVSDETHQRAKELEDDTIIFNISDILKRKHEKLDLLPTEYGELGCILYTSGTTGLPKGVKVPRKAIVNLADFYVRTYGLTSNDVFGLYSSIGFDAAYKAIFAAIFIGACLDIIPNEVKLNMVALNNHFISQGINHVDITTPVAKLLVKHVENVPLDVLFTGGEKLGEFNQEVNCRFVDGYGPTEAYVEVSTIDIKNRIDPSSVGHLISNIKAYILDREFRRVPIGAVGELYLAGNQIAKGYLNREYETNNVFLENPFDEEEDYGTLYRTGDLVRILPDGSIGIVGRHDSQVKIRGNRVELSEIEEVIREIDIVKDLTVQTVKNGSDKELVAYVVSSKSLDQKELKDEICSYVAEHKPPYMVPSFVIGLDEIPLNVNGKVDKRALPEVDRGSIRAEYAAPRNELEKEIVKAFEQVFDIEKVSIYDDFLSLGGDSLTAIKLLSYINSNITMADVLSFRTPEEIAKNIIDFHFELDMYSVESGCPLNSAQVNVFADVVIYNKGDAYQTPSYMVIPKTYSLKNILDALDRLIEAHPILSMTISKEFEDNDKNHLKDNINVMKDLVGLVKTFGMKRILSLANGFGVGDTKGIYYMLRSVIKLFKGEYPLLVKGSKPHIIVEHEFDKQIITDFFAETLNLYEHLSKFLIIESENSYYLFSMIHHIIFDATSAGVMKNDLQTLLDGGEIEYEDTFLQTSAFAHQIKESEHFDEASKYYESVLTNLDKTENLPEDRSSEGYSMRYCNLDFDKKAFKTFLRKTGISENIFFTSVFAYALSQLFSGDDVLISIIENGRDLLNENFIGMTSNVMPLVLDCHDQSIDSFVDYMSNMVYGVNRFSFYPILYLYLNYNFEVKTLFQFVPNWIVDEIVDIEDISSKEIVNTVLNSYGDFLTELLVQVHQTEEGYRLIIINSNKYSDKDMQKLEDAYVTILSNIINADMSSYMSSLLTGTQ